MKLGTKSLLYGVHQFIWHPVTVARAWRFLYGQWPDWKEAICIVVHDWGYWGCETMDGPDGKLHPLNGSTIAFTLFGEKYEELVLLHSRSMAEMYEQRPSKLCWPDKLSMMFDPTWFYLFRARLTGEIKEYHWNAIRCGFSHPLSTERQWAEKLKAWDLEKAKAMAATFK